VEQQMRYVNLADITDKAAIEARRLIRDQNRRSEPFRNRFDHTLRVLNWARRIHEVEGGDFGIITLAILFHDTGWRENVDHALVGAELAKKFYLDEGVDPVLVDRIVSAVRTHNKRDEPCEGFPIENYILLVRSFLNQFLEITPRYGGIASQSQFVGASKFSANSKYPHRLREATLSFFESPIYRALSW
jgi:hypothetical protein